MTCSNEIVSASFKECAPVFYNRAFDIKQWIKQNKVLVLPVCKKWFDLMETGEKTSEFRKPTKFIKDRLYNKDGSTKHYDYSLYVNGYGYHRPFIITKHEGFGTGYNNQYIFSDGSNLSVQSEDYNIFLGEIIYKANIKANESRKQSKVLKNHSR
jgi:hypothetical protein